MNKQIGNDTNSSIRIGPVGFKRDLNFFASQLLEFKQLTALWAKYYRNGNTGTRPSFPFNYKLYFVSKLYNTKCQSWKLMY